MGPPLGFRSGPTARESPSSIFTSWWRHWPFTSRTPSWEARSMTASGRPTGGSWIVCAPALTRDKERNNPSAVKVLRMCRSLLIFMPRLANLHHVVKERIRNFQELVWHPAGHNDHV